MKTYLFSSVTSKLLWDGAWACIFCPCVGHPEVIWFINDGVRSALLHKRAVCSNGFLRMERSPVGLHCITGSCWSSHPVQFHSGIAFMPLGSLIEALSCVGGGGGECVCVEGGHCDNWHHSEMEPSSREVQETCWQTCKPAHNAPF